MFETQNNLVGVKNVAAVFGTVAGSRKLTSRLPTRNKLHNIHSPRSAVEELIDF